MKRIYWRPQSVSRTALVLIAAISVVGLLLVENVLVTTRRPYFNEKMVAAQMAYDAMEAIYNARIELGPEIDTSADTTKSGIIGIAMSPVTSVAGDLTSKQTSINPNFAAVILDMLKQAGVREGDAVAVACSGSFPALNICVYAAVETLKAKPIVICSAAASQWGANVPGLLWIDMERVLNDENVFSTRSVAASAGGHEDRALGLTDEGREWIDDAINRNALEYIKAEDFTSSVNQRMQLYRKYAGRAPIKAFVNVGGGTISVGRSVGKRMFHPGLNLRPPSGIGKVEGVMPRFIIEGVPVVHLIHIPELAERFGLPIAPPKSPGVGEGDIFESDDYSKPLAATVLGVIVLSLYGFVRSDVGFRLLQLRGRRRESGHPAPMV